MDGEFWRNLILITVWSLVFGSLVQSIADLTGYVVLHRQHSQSDFGRIVKWRELSLGVKNLWRTAYDLLIASVITWRIAIGGTPKLAIILIGVTVTTLIAAWWAIQFLRGFRKENWGIPTMVMLETTNERQDVRESEQNIREVVQEKREVRLDERDANGAS